MSRYTYRITPMFQGEVAVSIFDNKIGDYVDSTVFKTKEECELWAKMWLIEAAKRRIYEKSN